MIEAESIDSNLPTGPRMPNLVGIDITRSLRLLKLVGIERPRLRLIVGENRGVVLDQFPPPDTILGPDSSVLLEIEEDNPIRHLPEVYQEEDTWAYDSVGAERPPHMLRSFLFIIQALLSGIGQHTENMHRYVTPEGAPPQFLPWLLKLMPLEFDASWSEERMRQILRDAPQLLRKRGTKEGLIAMIELYAGVKASIAENAWPHKGVCVGLGGIGESAIVSTVPSSDDAFTIELVTDEELSREQMERILRLVDAEKPLHLRASVVQRRSKKPATGSKDRVGIDHVVGVSRISGPVITEPARLGVRTGFSEIPLQEKIRATGGPILNSELNEEIEQ